MKTERSEGTFTPFQGLKKALERRGNEEDNIPTVKEQTDEEIFLNAMADVKEIKEFREIPLSDPPQFKYSKEQSKQSTETDESVEILRKIVNGERKIRLSDTGEYIEWVSPRIRKDIAQRLHRGDFSVQDYIDLHGMTLSEAEEAFRLFFQDALKRRLFCIKVIHGRGLRSPKGPVLKEALKTWLQGKFRKRILAYSSAKDSDGGLGATYIILKSQ
jgi:DNA-nicking Smr family endonuclease